MEDLRRMAAQVRKAAGSRDDTWVPYEVTRTAQQLATGSKKIDGDKKELESFHQLACDTLLRDVRNKLRHACKCEEETQEELEGTLTEELKECEGQVEDLENEFGSAEPYTEEKAECERELENAQYDLSEAEGAVEQAYEDIKRFKEDQQMFKSLIKSLETGVIPAALKSLTLIDV